MSGSDAREPATEPREQPLGRFRVETEAMADGRRIHYYEWPTEDADADGRPREQVGGADE